MKNNKFYVIKFLIIKLKKQMDNKIIFFYNLIIKMIDFYINFIEIIKILYNHFI